MRQENCPQEANVSEAIRSGTWETSITSHVAQCPVCQEVVQTSRWMQAMARSCEGNSALPDGSLLWRMAQLSERQTQVRRARRAIEWVEIVSSALVSAGLLAWAAWNWQMFQGGLVWLSSDLWSGLSVAGYWFAVSAPDLFWTAVAVVSLVLMFLASPLFDEG